MWQNGFTLRHTSPPVFACLQEVGHSTPFWAEEAQTPKEGQHQVQRTVEADLGRKKHGGEAGG